MYPWLYPPCSVLSCFRSYKRAFTWCPVLSLLDQKWLCLPPSLLPSLVGQPAPPREIPKQCWNTLLSPRSQSDCWVIPVYNYVLTPVCKSEKILTVLAVNPPGEWLKSNVHTCDFIIPTSTKIFIIKSKELCWYPNWVKRLIKIQATGMELINPFTLPT